MAFFLLLATGEVFAQTPGTSDEQAGAKLTVWVMTIGPGEEVYEKFGHNGIVVGGLAQVFKGIEDHDYVFNYGMFAFGPDFLPKFLQGDMQYWTEAFTREATVGEYRKRNRTLLMQELDLTPLQKLQLARHLLWNIREPNKFYTYNYYNSNCSTKVRDVLDMPLQGLIKAHLSAKPAGVSYRWHTRRIMEDSVVFYTSLEFILGHAVEKPLTAWEESFLPEEFARHLREIRMPDGRPLVKREWVEFQGTRPAVAAKPADWFWGYVVAGIGVAVLLLLPAMSSNRWLRRTFVGLSCGWALLTGSLGMFLAYAFSTSHWSVYWNENILQFSPAMLPLVVLIPISLFGRDRTVRKLTSVLAAVVVVALVGAAIPLVSPSIQAIWIPLTAGVVMLGLCLLIPEREARRMALPLAGLVAAGSILGLACKVLPGFYQSNRNMIALVLPASVALVLALWRILPKTADIQGSLSKERKR